MWDKVGTDEPDFQMLVKYSELTSDVKILEKFNWNDYDDNYRYRGIRNGRRGGR